MTDTVMINVILNIDLCPSNFNDALSASFKLFSFNFLNIYKQWILIP